MSALSKITAISLCVVVAFWCVASQAFYNTGNDFTWWKLARDLVLLPMMCVHIWRGRSPL